MEEGERLSQRMVEEEEKLPRGGRETLTKRGRGRWGPRERERNSQSVKDIYEKGKREWRQESTIKRERGEERERLVERESERKKKGHDKERGRMEKRGHDKYRVWKKKKTKQTKNKKTKSKWERDPWERRLLQT